MSTPNLPQRVVTALESSGVPFTLRNHSDFGVPIHSPIDFAKATGCDIRQVTKTLFLRGAGREGYAMAVCPVASRVDFAVLADLLHFKSITLATSHELETLIGQPRNGVSPLGIVEYPVAIEDSCFSQSTIFVGSGQAGYEIELLPNDLRKATKGIRGIFRLITE